MSRFQKIGLISVGVVVLVMASIIYFVVLGNSRQDEKTDDTNEQKGVYEGTLDRADYERIAGWAWDKGRPDVPIKVDLYVDDVLAASVLADKFRDTLVKAGKGNGRHGFFWNTPRRLKDGQRHSVSAKISGTNIELKMSPRFIKAPAK